MPKLADRITSALQGASPTLQRVVGGSVGSVAGAALGAITGGTGRSTGLTALVGGGVGAALGPTIISFLGGTPLTAQIEKQIDSTLGVVPAIESAVQAETGIQGRVVALARKFGRGSPEHLRTLEREKQRLEAAKVEPFLGFLF